MDWFEITDAENKKVIINASTVMFFEYDEGTDLTIINFIRGAFPALYVKGNITLDLKRLLNAHNNYVSRIGG